MCEVYPCIQCNPKTGIDENEPCVELKVSNHCVIKGTIYNVKKFGDLYMQNIFNNLIDRIL